MSVKGGASRKEPNPLYPVPTLAVVKPALDGPDHGIERVPGRNRNAPQARFGKTIERKLRDINPGHDGIHMNDATGNTVLAALHAGQDAAGNPAIRMPSSATRVRICSKVIPSGIGLNCIGLFQSKVMAGRHSWHRYESFVQRKRYSRSKYTLNGLVGGGNGHADNHDRLVSGSGVP